MQQEEECEKGQSTLRDTLMSFPWAVREPQQNLSLPLNKPWVQYKSQSLKFSGVDNGRQNSQEEKIQSLITGLFLNSLHEWTFIQLKTTVYKTPVWLNKHSYLCTWRCVCAAKRKKWVWMSFLNTHKYFSDQHQCTGEGWFFFSFLGIFTYICLLNEQNRALIRSLYSEEHLDQAIGSTKHRKEEDTAPFVYFNGISMILASIARLTDHLMCK